MARTHKIAKILTQPIAENSCPNCYGTGWVESETWSLVNLTRTITMKVRCPQCNGLGVLDNKWHITGSQKS